MWSLSSLFKKLNTMTIGFALPSMLLVVAMGSTVSGYTPLVFDPSQYQTQSALATELKSKDAAALELDVGNAFARVRWNGADLGTRAWAPYTWPLPAGAASRGRLEVTVYTHVWNIFGDRDRPDAQWDMRFWNPQHDSETVPGLSTIQSH